jgi:hypothetical protein
MASQAPALDALDHFTSLRASVLKAFGAARREFEQKLRATGTTSRLHFFMVIGVVFVGWFFEPGPRIVALAELGLRQLSGIPSNDLPPLFWGSISVIAFGVWTLLIALISSNVFRRAARAPIALMAYSVLVAPAFPLLVAVAAALGAGAAVPLAAVITWYLVAAGFSFFVWGALLGILHIISGGVPQTLFLLSTSVSAGNEHALLPGYEQLVRRAIEDSTLLIYDIGEPDLRRVEAVARWKFDGINGRVQAFSFVVGALGLLGVLALVLSATEIQTALDLVWNMLSSLVTPGEPAPVRGYSIAIIFLAVVILVAVVYFARSYAELRVLEVIGIICVLTPEAPTQSKSGVRAEPSLYQVHQPVEATKPARTLYQVLLVLGIVALDIVRHVVARRQRTP